MNFIKINSNMPHFINREIEKIQEIVAPIMKKATTYMFWSFPLIVISILNLFFLVFIGPLTKESMFPILIYAIVGAIGFALSKETKFRKKEMMNASTDYMIERINKSDIMPDSRKKEYVNLLKTQPMTSFNNFILFLNEENNHSKNGLYS
ncbi:YwnF family protein [Fredinandcohnia quinoae]|uniref:YwnF family protein n=1 Tax=Fredinandcohnia quinoae TaxID=2918902 RepID=A0AAW5E2D8_9BACI|nr:YwnF family protein [Fredinandcohnia sp. SECRCQ15]MCH1625724.1 YwnF family protein [Fredinandcohnia sp. SECRCQ15]